MEQEYTFTTTASAFELGTDDAQRAGKAAKTYITYSDDAVMRYRAPSIEDVMDNPARLVKMIRHHLTKQAPRLKWLEAYYLANNPGILDGQRRLNAEKSDHRARHAWAGIISDFLNAYTLSNPVKIEAPEDGAADAFLELVAEFNQRNDIDAHNMELGKDQNNVGRAFELLQRTEDDTDRIYRLEPTEVFMIYDETVRSRVIGACRYYPINAFDEDRRTWRVELYTPALIVTYKPADVMTEPSLTEEEIADHAFGGVPIVEYRSDRYRMGVFEKQLPLIDLYDAAQSDTANYMTDLNDALLVIDGKYRNVETGEALRELKDSNILALIPDENDNGTAQAGKAYYLTKSYDVAGVEAYKGRIKQDIFTTASTPDLSDAAFAGTQSGEALKYKMFGLQQKRSDKEKYFAKGLRVRYKLLENLKRTVAEYTGEPADLYFAFTPNLPRAFMEELKDFVNAGGRVSQETMLGLLSFVDNAAEELERVKDEKAANMADFGAGLGLPPVPGGIKEHEHIDGEE